MFIIWGKKAVYRNLGYVADYCPICRGARAFRLQRVGMASHVYYVSFGEGALVGHQRTCCDCATTLKGNPATYATVASKPSPIDELLHTTYPNYETSHRQRAEIDRRVANNSLSSDERRALIREPFLLLSPKVERRFATTHIDGRVALSLLGALVLVLVLPRAAAQSLGPQISMLVPLGLGVALVTWQGLGSGGRFFKRDIYPPLARALSPLRPTVEEIEAMLRELRQGGHKIGKKTRAQEILAHLTQGS